MGRRSRSTLSRRWDAVSVEFAHHLPYTLVSTLIAMAGVWWFAMQHMNHGTSGRLFQEARSVFHLFHPLHICLSAVATTALFWRHERHALRAALVGALGTIIPCGLSDYVFPYLGGRLLGQPMELHMCIVEHPQLFFPFLAFGIFAGFLAEDRLSGSHLFSHGAHVFVSSAASLLYFVSFGFTGWLTDVLYVFPTFATIVLAVWLPCCISDIVVPVSAAHPAHHA